MPEARGRFYQFVHSAAQRFAGLPILRVHRHNELPEGTTDHPPLHDLHPGDIVEVAPIQTLSAGAVNPQTLAAVDRTTEIATVVNHPHLEPILDADADEAVAGAAFVQEAPPIPAPIAAPTSVQTDVVEAPSAVPGLPPQRVVLVSEPGTPEGEIPAVTPPEAVPEAPVETHLTPAEAEAIRDSPSGV